MSEEDENELNDGQSDGKCTIHNSGAATCSKYQLKWDFTDSCFVA